MTATEFKGPIVEGAWYEREDGSVGRCGAFNSGFGHVLDDPYRRDSGERVYAETPRLTRRVYITHTDPAEVVAELEAEADAIGVGGSDYDNGIYAGYVNAARIVGGLLGVEQVRDAVKEWVRQCPESDEYQLEELRTKAADLVSEKLVGEK